MSEETIHNTAWVVLGCLILYFWFTPAQARWMPDNPVIVDEVDCDDLP